MTKLPYAVAILFLLAGSDAQAQTVAVGIGPTGTPPAAGEVSTSVNWTGVAGATQVQIRLYTSVGGAPGVLVDGPASFAPVNMNGTFSHGFTGKPAYPTGTKVVAVVTFVGTALPNFTSAEFTVP